MAYPWKSGSCWLDTSLNVVYWVVRGDWDDFDSRFSEQRAESTMQTLRLMFELRIIADSENGEGDISQLEFQRDNFRQHLVSQRAYDIPSMESWQPLWVRPLCSIHYYHQKHIHLEILQSWLGDCVSLREPTGGKPSQRPYINCHSIRSYFRSSSLYFKTCEGPGDTVHYELSSSPSEPPVYTALPYRRFQEFKGDVNNWWRQEITANPVPTSVDACWRSVGGVMMCANEGVDVSVTRIYLSISVFLLIEAGINVQANGLVQGADGEDTNGEWNFPAKLFPLDPASAKDGVVYDIVARVFTNGNHFISRYRQPDTSNIFNYDSMQHGGFCQRINGAKLSQHLAGKDVPMPSGYRTQSVIYRLRGGLRAQQIFYRERVEALKRLHGIQVDGLLNNSQTPQISLVRKGVTVVKDSDRAWHLRPKSAGVVDYDLESGADRLMARVTEVEKELFSDSDVDLRQSTKRKSTLRRVESCDSEQGDRPADGNNSEDMQMPSSVRSAPGSDSEFPFNCQCGVSGSGHELPTDEEVVCCDKCGNWCHLACQLQKAVSVVLYPKDPFICPSCSRFMLDDELPPSRTINIHKRRLANRLLYVHIPSSSSENWH